MVFTPATGSSHPSHPSHRPSSETPLQQLFRTLGKHVTRAVSFLRSPFKTARPGGGQAKKRRTGADQRRHPRIPIADTTVQVTDGCLFATALIENISSCGICLRNLPEQLYRSGGQLTVFSSDNPGIPILHIQPRWENINWSGKTIGATILNASETWRLFLMHAAGALENSTSRQQGKYSSASSMSTPNRLPIIASQEHAISLPAKSPLPKNR